jgi:hypothetical protein
MRRTARRRLAVRLSVETLVEGGVSNQLRAGIDAINWASVPRISYSSSW